jgi:hypothetical protein
MMRVGEIGDIAQEWVDVHGRHIVGFCGSYLFGSIATMPPDAPFATYRDVDLIVVLDTGTKSTDENLEVAYKGLMLEVGFIGVEEHHDVEAVLARPDRAGTLAHTRILADPLGVLVPLQRAVAASYTEQQWVLARCEVEKQTVRSSLEQMAQPPAPLPRLLSLVGVMFGLSGLLAVANLEMPTSRRALIIMKRSLDGMRRSESYTEVLRLCGVENLRAEQVERFHRAMLTAFDRAVEVKQTVVPYSFKVASHTRPYADEAIDEMIREGHHREAAFYLALPYGGINAIIQNDAEDHEKAVVQAGYDKLLDALDLLHPHHWSDRVQRAHALATEMFRLADAAVAEQH